MLEVLAYTQVRSFVLPLRNLCRSGAIRDMRKSHPNIQQKALFRIMQLNITIYIYLLISSHVWPRYITVFLWYSSINICLGNLTSPSQHCTNLSTIFCVSIYQLKCLIIFHVTGFVNLSSFIVSPLYCSWRHLIWPASFQREEASGHFFVDERFARKHAGYPRWFTTRWVLAWVCKAVVFPAIK